MRETFKLIWSIKTQLKGNFVSGFPQWFEGVSYFNVHKFGASRNAYTFHKLPRIMWLWTGYSTYQFSGLELSWATTLSPSKAVEITVPSLSPWSSLQSRTKHSHQFSSPMELMLPTFQSIHPEAETKWHPTHTPLSHIVSRKIMKNKKTTSSYLSNMWK